MDRALIAHFKKLGPSDKDVLRSLLAAEEGEGRFLAALAAFVEDEASEARGLERAGGFVATACARRMIVKVQGLAARHVSGGDARLAAAYGALMRGMASAGGKGYARLVMTSG